MFVFQPYAFSLQPIIIKNSINHWPAKAKLNYEFLKQLYARHPYELDTFDADCQFLNFKSNFLTLKHFFEMDDTRAEKGKPSWYVGFSNCQMKILQELRQLYPIPHFLPADAEVPNTDYIFLGYEQGATMHVRIIF